MSSATPRRGRSAGLTDIRMIIALLFVIYGAVLTVLGIAPGPEDLEKSAGINVNLWAGLGMLAFAASFAAWTWIRPVVVPDPAETAETGEDQAG